MDSPAHATDYCYDALDNLTRVIQGRQRRRFTYDSLSRLTQATNPESGTTRYRYDANGNLTWKRDARGVEAAYAYDELDRLTGRSYSYRGTDPAVGLDTTRVDYGFDNCGRYSKGRMCSVTAGKGNDRSLQDRLRRLRRPGAGGGEHPDHGRDRLPVRLRLRQGGQHDLPDLSLGEGRRDPLRRGGARGGSEAGGAAGGLPLLRGRRPQGKPTPSITRPTGGSSSSGWATDCGSGAATTAVCSPPGSS